MSEAIRINKYIAGAGICSRRQADRMIEEGRVTVNGHVAACGESVTKDDEVLVDGKAISTEDDEVVLVYNKPVGIVCTAEKREPDNVIDHIGYPKRIYPVGRLDKDSHGLLILTNIGDIAYEVTRSAGNHEKEYEVTVNKSITGQFLIAMQRGVYLKDLNKTTAEAAVKKLGDKTFSIVLHQGLNRQIRRMCEELGYVVKDLKRVRELDLTLDGIAEDEYRELSPKEIDKLKQKLAVK